VHVRRVLETIPVLTTEMCGLQGAFKRSIDIQFVFTLRFITEVPKSSLLKEQTSPQLRETQTLKARTVL
jgi:hypothetical protein